MGLNTAELWNNIGLCCFHASQYDMCLICYERALALAEDGESLVNYAAVTPKSLSHL